jgi:hypothetical protein
MLVSVTFYVGMRGDWLCWLCSAVKEISQEEGVNRLSPSSSMLREAAFVQKLLISA